jgi:nucleotide-binding universal stress UspA family protein
MYKHILLPTDGSTISEKAVKHCVRLAKSIGAKITAINVMPEFQMVMVDEGFVSPGAPQIRKRFEEGAVKRSQKILAEVKAAAVAVGVDCDCVSVSSGVPYELIIKQAKKTKCDLIMMASHGRKGLASILLGSETAKVLTHSTVPVLVVR